MSDASPPEGMVIRVVLLVRRLRATADEVPTLDTVTVGAVTAAKVGDAVVRSNWSMIALMLVSGRDPEVMRMVLTLLSMVLLLKTVVDEAVTKELSTYTRVRLSDGDSARM